MSKYQRKTNRKYDRWRLIKTYPVKYIKKVQWDVLEENLKRLTSEYLENEWNTYDLTYRIYHKSFKMYYMAENAIDIWQMLLNSVGIKSFVDYEDFKKVSEDERENSKAYWIAKVRYVATKMKLIGAQELLVKQIRGMTKLYFELSKNRGPWDKESLILMGNYHVARQVVQSTFEMLLEWKSEKGLLFDEKRRCLDSKEALVMETLYCFSLRYMDDKEESKLKMREYIVGLNAKKSSKNI